MISDKEIRHIATLARLELSEAEVVKYQHQLSAVLDYIDQLNKCKTDNEPTAQVSNLINIWREDKVEKYPENEIKKMIEGVVDEKSGYIKVNKIL